MPKVGEYKYPGDLGPDEAEEWMDTLVFSFGNRAEDEDSFANEVGHASADSGSFRRKVADARKYGLMTPRGTLEATELGKRLADPRDERERAEVIAEMLENVDLLKDIYEDLDGGTEDDFWRVIGRLTTANPKEARETADDIEPLYRKLQSAKEKVEKESQDEPNEGKDIQQDQDLSQSGAPSSTPNTALYVKVGGDELRFSDLTGANIELVRTFLKNKKEEIKAIDDTEAEGDEEGPVQEELV